METTEANKVDNVVKVDTKYIYKLLLDKYNDPNQYACAGEVSNSTGYAASRRLDFVVADCWPSHGYQIHGFEIKVSKSDLRRELMEPAKHNIFFDHIDTYTLVAPVDIVDMDIIPAKWGVLVVKDGKLVTKRRPIPLHDESTATINRGFAFSLIRAINKQCAQSRAIDKLLREKYDEGVEYGKYCAKRDTERWNEDRRANEWKIKLVERLGLYSEEMSRRIEDILIPVVKTIREKTGAIRYLENSMKEFEWSVGKIEEMLGKLKEPVGVQKEASTSNSGIEKES